ncbi:MAG: acyl-ACP--UDP-N-acetylglucosamine O-acyltransferase [Gemmataceae bacterium]|nr:acyl-ACP--UDP-N-acetylglucosamine O-acyltransferase [Gemmataceae bacterium]
MPVATTARIHPTAVISPEAEIGEGVQIGPFAVIDGPVKIGENCEIKSGARLTGHLTLGKGNTVYTGACLGEAPQHLKYEGEITNTIIGNNNVFREGVTVHRGTKEGIATRIGNNNFFMVNSHVAHDCKVGNNCILVNGSLVGGHATIQDGAFLSGNSAVHQFCKVGRLALVAGVSATTTDLPPFLICRNFNIIVGVNVIGMRRGGISNKSIDGVRRAYHIIYREDLLLPQSLALTEKELGDISEVMEFTSFIRGSTRGISLETERTAA